jgi:integrase
MCLKKFCETPGNMASYTIVKRKKADGSIRYTARVRVKKDGQVVYNGSRTFSKRAVANEWGKQVVHSIERDGHDNNTADVSLGELIRKYLVDFQLEISRTKLNVLELIMDCDIASENVMTLKPMHIIQHCKARNAGGAGPATLAHDVSYIKGVLKTAKPMWGYEVDESCVLEALPVLHNLNLVGKGERRSRRPTSDELDRLREGLSKRMEHKGSNIPFLDLLDFSILSCMRIGEVCSVLVTDIDEEQRAVMVRDRKDPRKKIGNHMMVPLLGGAWEILQRQPKDQVRVFPYNPRSVTAGFQRVRNELDIQDLRYHDLRREGASRLFEQGYTIDEVAQVTGHRNINTLWQVYTELYPKRLHDKALTLTS